MPTEFEYKYVLEVNHTILENVTSAASSSYFIEQMYLCRDPAVRIRKRDGRYILTLKKSAGGRVIEIEQDLSERDGSDLWAACEGPVVLKLRCEILHDGLKWEVDFFFDPNVMYMAMAEIELSEGTDRPSTVPECIRGQVLYEVPLTDNRFSNTKLGDIEYASKLYQSILDSRKNT